MNEEKFLTVREVAQLLGVTEKDILVLAEKGTLPAYRIGGVYLRFKKGQVLEYKKSVGPLSPSRAAREEASVAAKVFDFLYLNDFYIIAFAIVAALLMLIFRGG